MSYLAELNLNVATGIAATVILLMGVRGLFPHLTQPRRVEAYHLAMAFVLCLLGGAGRTVYWDLVRTVLSPEAWIALRDTFGGVQANVFWNLILIWAGLHLLKLLHLLIPLSERSNYSMWTAWNFPVHLGRVLCVLRFRNKKRK